MNISPALIRVRNAAQFRLDKFAAEPINRGLERRFAADPELWLARMDEAVGRGLEWFRQHLDLTMSALHVLQQARESTGDSRFDILDERIARYRDTIHDPALRLLVPDYEPERFRHLPDVMDVRPYSKGELLMLEAVWADRGDAEAILARLRACSDGGMYGSTHIIVGGLAMKRAGVELDGRIDALMAAEVPCIARGNRATSYAGDVFAERIVVLQWLERHDLVSPAWILRLLRAQQPDGGWKARNIPPIGRSNQHTSCLAIGALAQFIHNSRSR